MFIVWQSSLKLLREGSCIFIVFLKFYTFVHFSDENMLQTSLCRYMCALYTFCEHSVYITVVFFSIRKIFLRKRNTFHVVERA